LKRSQDIKKNTLTLFIQEYLMNGTFCEGKTEPLSILHLALRRIQNISIDEYASFFQRTLENNSHYIEDVCESIFQLRTKIDSKGPAFVKDHSWLIENVAKTIYCLSLEVLEEQRIVEEKYKITPDNLRLCHLTKKPKTSNNPLIVSL
jgi:hypothetical protein